MSRRPWLARRLIVGAVIWIALSVGAGGVFLSYAFQNAVLQSFDAQLGAQARAILAGLDAVDADTIQLSAAPEDARFTQVFSGWYWQVSRGGAAVLRSRSLWDTELSNVDFVAPASVRDLVGPRGETLRAAVLNAKRSGIEDMLTVSVAVTLSAIDPEIARFNFLLFGALGLLAAGLVVAILLQVWLGLSPLRRLTRELAAIRNGETERLSNLHPREVEPLVEAFNDVRAHDLQTLSRARKEAGNLAHALKLPLARLAADIGDAPDALRNRVSASIDELKALVELHTARASTAALRGISARPVSLRPLVDDIVSALRKIHADKSVHVDVLVAADVIVRADEDDLSELLGNLIDNAFKWAFATIGISAEKAADEIVLIIADDGPGIPEEEVARGVQRGRRLDETVPGSGLGLSIALDIADAYGGSLNLHRSRVLGGLGVEVRLPLKAAATKPLL